MVAQRCLQPPQGIAAVAAARHGAQVPRLHTDRLILRAPVVADADLWATLFAGDDAPMLGGHLTAEEAWESFCVYTAGWILHGHGLWSVDLQQTGTLIGFVLVGLEWGDADPELGYLFAPDARGQGFATEAARAARNHGLAVLGDGALVSCIDTANAPSQRVARRLGARPDPTAPHIFRYGSAS